MTGVKAAKEVLLSVGFIAFSILLYSFISDSSASKLYLAYPGYNFHDLRFEIITFFCGVIGTQYYFLKNVWINFKSDVVIYFMIGFSLVWFLAALFLLLSNHEVREITLQQFDDIDFPIEEDKVERNIMLSVVEYTKNLLSAALVISIFALIVGNFQLIIQSVRKKKAKEKTQDKS